MRFNHLRRRGFIALLGAAAVTMWGCLGVLPGSIFLVVIGTTPAATQQGDLNAINKRFSDLYAAGNYAAALVEAQKAEALVKARFGVNHANYGVALDNLAIVYQPQGKYADAEGLHKRALAIREKALGANHPDVASTLNNLAIVYQSQGKYAEAERSTSARWRSRRRRSAQTTPMWPRPSTTWPSCTCSKASTPRPSRSTSARWRSGRRRSAPDHPDVARASTTWPSCTRPGQVRRGRAALQARAGDPGEGARPRPPRRGQSLNNLANVYQAKASTPRPSRSTSARWRSGRRRSARTIPMWPQTLNNLAIVYEAKASTPRPSRSTSARWRSRRRRSAQTTPMWPSASTTWPSCTRPRQVRRGRGALQARAGDPGEGARRRPPRCGPDPQQPGHPLRQQRQQRERLAYSRKATAAVIAHAATETTARSTRRARAVSSSSARTTFVRHVANLAAAAQKRLEPEAALGREALDMAQWANQSSAAAAVQQMGLRFAAGTDALAALVRERQDLAAVWRDRDKALIAAFRSRKASRTSRDRRIAQRACRRPRASSPPTRHGSKRSSRLCGAGEPEAAQGRGGAEACSAPTRRWSSS